MKRSSLTREVGRVAYFILLPWELRADVALQLKPIRNSANEGPYLSIGRNNKIYNILGLEVRLG